MRPLHVGESVRIIAQGSLAAKKTCPSENVVQIHPAGTSIVTADQVTTPPPIGPAAWPAASVGLPLLRLAPAGRVSLLRLSQHRGVLNLITRRGDLVAVVEDAIGPGPYNIVVAAWDRFVAAIKPDDPAYLSDYDLAVGSLSITLCHAPTWNPDPKWPEIAQSPAVTANLDHLRVWFGQQRGAPLDRFTATAFQQAASQVVTPAAANECWQGLACLLGLGPGLTPLGDDWLAGWLLRQHLALYSAAPGSDLPGYPPLDMIAAFITERAASQTTRLSQAWLRAAAAGWVDEPWHQLLRTLVSGPPIEMARAAARIVQHGATSGYAMLAGFLQETIV